jgi:hypothetical protein
MRGIMRTFGRRQNRPLLLLHGIAGHLWNVQMADRFNDALARVLDVQT